MESYTKDDTIFVQIASYRDPELQWTLKDLFEKAKRPENIFVGICHQYDMKGDEDKHLFEIPFSHPKQLRIDEVDYRESQGCCWARNRVQKLWKGEKWTLMIDSHMRFEKDWDEILVKRLKGTEKENILISQFCGDTLSNSDKTNYVCQPNFNQEHFDKNSMILFGFGVNINDEKKPIAMVSARFIFALSKIISIIYDKYLYFFGEEIDLTVRFWTSGWNIMTDSRIIAHHKRVAKMSNMNQNDNKNVNKKDYISYSRVKHLLNTKKTNDPEVLENIKEYGLGDKRTLRDYERFSGVDFRRKITREHTKQGIFENWQEVSKISDVKNIFNNKYNN